MGDASGISWVVSAAAALGANDRRAMYARAVADGIANMQCSADQERRYGTLRLLTLATLRLPDLALYAEVLHSYAGDRWAACLVAPTLTGAASGAIRLAHRALHTHALELGYRCQAWTERVVDGAGEQLRGSESLAQGLPLALLHARLATLALTRATASTASDPMLVPGQIADALARLLAIYLVSVEVASPA